MLLQVFAWGFAWAGDSLYRRFGGERLQVVVDLYVDKLSTDARTERFFQRTDRKRIKRVLAEQLCALMNGPCHYTGDSMRDVHAGQGIGDREFFNGVELLREVMISEGVGIRERNELLALLAPMKRDVVDP
jgi:hemoglobin